MQMVLSSAYRPPNIMLRCALLVLLVSCATAQTPSFGIQFCNETVINELGCHFLAECGDNMCTCPRGTVDLSDGGDPSAQGKNCGLESYVARLVVEYVEGDFDPEVVLPLWGVMLANAFTSVITTNPSPLFSDSVYLADHAVYQVTTIGGKDVVTLSGLFRTSQTASAVCAKLKETQDDIPTALYAEKRIWGPQKYAFYLPTTSAYLQVGPSGLEVTDVFFESNCLDSGCWVVDITYSVGSPENMNVLYIPIASDGVLADPSMNDPVNFPCGSNQWDGETLIEQTACCMSHFEDKFRVNANFAAWLAGEEHVCPETTGPRPWETDVTETPWTDMPLYGTSADAGVLKQLPGNFIVGKFSGMEHSIVEYSGVVDYTQGIHMARLRLDEHEVRMLAAQRAGTLQVQYTLDLYVGIAEFSPTSTKFMDSAMKQVEIHLEKSDFFSVAQHSNVGPSPDSKCCGPECKDVWIDGVFQMYQQCPIEFLGQLNGCVIVEGPFEYNVDPCSKCPIENPECVISILECQNFYFQGVYYVFPQLGNASLGIDPVVGNVTLGAEGTCCIRIAVDDDGNDIFYPPECNTRTIKGCENIYVREQDEDTKYPMELVDAAEDEFASPYNFTFIACCTQTWEDMFPQDCDAIKPPGTSGGPGWKKRRDKYLECMAARDSYVTSKCFLCPENMPECLCNNVPCPGGDRGPVSGFNLRLNEVLDPTDRANGKVLQYLQVSFTTGTGYTPARTTGAIALSSVVVAKDMFYETAEFEQACFSSEGSIIQDGTTRADYDARWENTCAPTNDVCERINFLADNFVMFNVPLGADYFNRSEFTFEGDTNVYVEFVVTLEKAGTPGTFATLIKLAYPLVPGGVNTWCQADELATDLQQVANADLLVGSAMTQPEWERLMLFRDIAGSKLDPADATEFATASIESGLMTLVIKGNHSFFTLPGTVQYKLELEDVMTLHVMENGDGMWQQIVTMMEAQDNAGAAFKVETDRWGHKAYLEPTDALMRLCSFSPRRSSVTAVIPSACIARRDIRNRLPVHPPGAFDTALELVEGSEADAIEFLGNIFGTSEYTTNLGKAFPPLIREFWGVNDRYIRAWWINPGYEWTPSSTNTGSANKFTISQKLVMFALINLNEGFSTPAAEDGTVDGDRRSSDDGDDAVYVGKRMLLAATPGGGKGSGVGASSLQFPISAKDVVCTALDCDMEAMTLWAIDFGLSEEETCLETASLSDLLRGRIKLLLKASPSTSPYESVQVLDVALDRAGVRCSGNRRALSQTGGGTATVNTIVLFADKRATLNVDEVLGAGQGVTGMRAAEVLPAGITVINTNQVVTPQPADTPAPGSADKAKAPADDEDDEESGRQITIIMAAVFGAVGSVLIVVAGVMAWKMTTDKEPEISIVEALNPQEFKEHAGKAPLASEF